MKLLLAIMLMPLIALSATWTDSSTGITWSYTVSNGKATVTSGSEWMPAISKSATGPIRIPAALDGYTVDCVGNFAFYACSGLTSVMIPSGVTSIGEHAFRDCRRLTSVTIPEGVASIGSFAFYGCSGLTSVTIPEGVTSIGSYAFYGCSGLTSVMISEGVASIGSYAFSGCSGLADRNGLIIIGGVLCDYVGDSSSVTIPISVKSIGSYAFSGCSELTSVMISEGVKSIGSYAFSGCSGLTSVTIPDGVTSIGSHAFYGCSGLTSLTIPPSVTSIGSAALSGCSGLTHVSVPFVGAKRGNTGASDSLFGYIFGTASYNGAIATKQKYSSSSYSTSTFYIPSSLVSVEITDETMIGYGAFYNCSGLSSVDIPATVVSVGSLAFSGCSNICSVTVPGWKCGIDFSSVTNLTIAEGVESIESSAFSGCRGVKSVKISGSVTSIGAAAFRECSGLTSITIPSSVTSIGGNAFYGCSLLASVTIHEGVTSVGRGAFYNCSSLTSVTIPPSVTSIGQEAFVGCGGLMRVDITDAAKWCEISFADYYANPLCYAKHLYLNGEEVKDLVVPDGVTSICERAFYNCSELTSATIPSSVTSIGFKAFEGCSGLMRVNITDMAKWCEIAFADYYANPLCYANHLYLNGTEVKDLMVPEGATYIGRYAFEDCSGFTSVTVPSSVTSIGYCAFSGCSGLMSVTIPSSVTDIGSSAFSGCSGLTSVTMPGQSAMSMSNVFPESYQKIASLTIADGTTSIRDFAFCDCNGLMSVMIPSGVTSIGYSAFKGCSGLTSITIPSSVTDVGSYAFEGCNNICSVTVPGWKCGIDFSSVTNLMIVEGVVSIESWAFSGCSRLTSVTIPDSVTHIESCAFRDCTGLMSIMIPSSVTSIGSYAFEGCSGLTAVTISEGETSIGDYAFSGCSGLTSVLISEGVTSIGLRAFSGCSGLTSITIPKSVTNIGYYAFSDCSGLTDMVLPFVGSCRGNTETSESVFCYVFGGSASDDGMIRVSQMYSSRAYSGLFIPASLRTVVITDETVIGHGAFYGCNGLTSVTLSGGVTSIGDYAFGGCSGLTAVTIPDGVTNVGNYAFDGCSRLTSVTIPASVTSVDDDAFYGCHAIADATVPGWKCGIDFASVTNLIITKGATCIRDSAFSSSKNLIAVDIPEGVTSIGASAFEDCERMTSVKLPGSLESIGRLAFHGCDKLTEITMPKDAWKVGQSIGYPDWLFKCVGETEWALDEDVFHSAPHSVRSGNPGVAEAYGRRSTTISTILCGKGVGSFWWRVDCEPKADDIDEYYDYAAFSIDGVEVGKIAGKKDWERIEYIIPDSGIHMLSWTFARDDYDEDEALYENTAWLDDILFCQGKVEVSFSANGAEGDLPEKIVGVPGERITLPMPNNLKKGTMMFMGWSDGDSVYASGSEYALPLNDVLLVAVWTEYWTLDRVLNVENVTFTTGGKSDWGSDFVMSHDGMVSLRSGAISDSQSTWVQGRFVGKGELSFWAKSSGEFYRGKMCDLLMVTLDGVEIYRDATNDWTKIVVPVTNDGDHTIRWTYSKNETRSSNDDCVWVDEVCWTPSAETTVVPTIAELAEAFGAESDVVKGIKDEVQLAAFNQFLKDCAIASASDMSEGQKTWAYQSFKLSEIMTAPQLFEEEPVLKFDDIELSGGNLALTVSLHVGEEAVALAKDKLVEKIRVGTALDAIVETPLIVARPSADGTSLTFTVAHPQGDKGFVRILIE